MKLDFLDNFGVYVAIEKGLSRQTVTSYMNDLNSFYVFCRDKGIGDRDIVEADVLEFFYERVKYWSAATIARKISALKQFFKFLIKQDLISHNPMIQILGPKNISPLPYVPSEDEMCRLINLIMSKASISELYARDLVIVELLYSCGLRVSELCNLHVRDVQKDCVYVIGGKGSQDRVVPVNVHTMRAINTYIDCWRGTHCTRKISGKMLKHNSGKLLVSLSGESVTRETVWRRIKYWARQLGDAINLHPHSFRHAFASHMLMRGMDIRIIQALLGHVSLTSTNVYTHISDSDLQDKFVMYHPRNVSK